MVTSLRATLIMTHGIVVCTNFKRSIKLQLGRLQSSHRIVFLALKSPKRTSSEENARAMNMITSSETTVPKIGAFHQLSEYMFLGVPGKDLIVAPRQGRPPVISSRQASQPKLYFSG